MDQPLKQRLIGAAVLAALAVIFLPMLLKGPDVREPDAAQVPLSMPPTPGQDFETRELPLTVPEQAPAGGVLGMDGGAPASAGATVADDNTVPDDAVAPVEPGAAAATPTATAAVATAPAATAPAVVPAPRPGSEGAAVGGGAFVVNIGSFANRANAQALASKLGAAGLPVLSDPVHIATGDATRLRVGPYADRAAAEAARLRVQSAVNVGGSVIALDADAGAAKPASASAPTASSPAAPKPVVPQASPATAAASAPKPAAAPAPESGMSAGFAVQLSAPAAESDANALRDRARAAGLSSFVQRIDTAGGVRYRVRVGPYADRASAESALAAINAKLGTHGIVMRHP
jgi:cell division septation protein DedD